MHLFRFSHTPLPVAMLSAMVALPAPAAPAALGDPTCCTADYWCHGSVDIFDLIRVLEDWGSTEYPWADFNDDGMVDGQDLGYLLAHWGPCSQDLSWPDAGELHVVGQDVTSNELAANGMRVWDIYLQFPDPEMLLINVLDTNIACQGDIDTCFFHGDPVGDPKEPQSSMFPLNQFFWDMSLVTYDSFVTVGLRYGDNNSTEGDPNLFASDFLDGATLGGAGGGAGWFSFPPEAQGKAGDYPFNSILIASLTVPDNAALIGEVTAMYQQPNGDLVIGTADVKLTKLGDLNFDGVVDVGDLLILLAGWGPCENYDDCPGDLTGCGIVNVTDLLILLSNWG